jgi:alpha-amylase
MEERDRMREKEGEGARREIEAWTGFRFPGRRGRYSAMQWRAEHFKGVDWDEKGRERGVWRFVGKEW